MARTGIEAYRRAVEGGVDVVLLDVHRPGGGAAAALQQLLGSTATADVEELPTDRARPGVKAPGRAYDGENPRGAHGAA